MTASKGLRHKRPNTPWPTRAIISDYLKLNARRFKGDNELPFKKEPYLPSEFTAIKLPKGMTPDLLADEIGQGATPSAIRDLIRETFPEKEFLWQNPRPPKPKPVAAPTVAPAPVAPEEPKVIPGSQLRQHIKDDIASAFRTFAVAFDHETDELEARVTAKLLARQIEIAAKLDEILSCLATYTAPKA